MRGPHVMRGYLGRSGTDRVIFRESDGALLTGDDGRLDAEGRLYVHGRHDGQVKIRGTRLSAAEIERAVTGIESVGAAALVVGPSGAEPVLDVEGTAPGSAVRQHLGMLVGAWKVPSDIRVVGRLPVNDRGRSVSLACTSRRSTDMFLRTEQVRALAAEVGTRSTFTTWPRCAPPPSCAPRSPSRPGALLAESQPHPEIVAVCLDSGLGWR